MIYPANYQCQCRPWWSILYYNRPLHKSHNVPVPYPTMHHFEIEMYTFLLQMTRRGIFFLMHYWICEMFIFKPRYKNGSKRRYWSKLAMVGDMSPFFSEYWQAMPLAQMRPMGCLLTVVWKMVPYLSPHSKSLRAWISLYREPKYDLNKHFISCHDKTL